MVLPLLLSALAAQPTGRSVGHLPPAIPSRAEALSARAGQHPGGAPLCALLTDTIAFAKDLTHELEALLDASDSSDRAIEAVRREAEAVKAPGVVYDIGRGERPDLIAVFAEVDPVAFGRAVGAEAGAARVLGAIRPFVVLPGWRSAVHANGDLGSGCCGIRVVNPALAELEDASSSGPRCVLEAYQEDFVDTLRDLEDCDCFCGTREEVERGLGEASAHLRKLGSPGGAALDKQLHAGAASRGARFSCPRSE